MPFLIFVLSPELTVTNEVIVSRLCFLFVTNSLNLAKSVTSRLVPRHLTEMQGSLIYFHWYQASQWHFLCSDNVGPT